MIKLSDYIFKYLREKGIDDIFVLPGGGAMHLVDSLGKSGIKYTHFHHEQSVAIAAEAYGQHTNHLGVALVTSGPGGTNTITAVASGWIDSIPMMIISGQAKRSDLIGNRGVRQIGSQEVTITEIVKPITKYAVRVDQPNKIKYYLQKAYYEATTGRKGPVWIDIPLDVQAIMVEPDVLEEYLPEFDIKNRKIDSEVMIQVMNHIRNSKKPLLLVGNGVEYADAKQDLLKLIDKLHIPTQTTWMSIDLLWNDHQLYAGHPGGLGERGANYIIQECDLLLTIGARLDNSITAFNEEEFAPNAYKIVVDIDKNELNKFNMKIDLPICSDAKHFICELDRMSEEQIQGNYEKWICHCTDIRKKYPIVLSEYAEETDYVNGYYFTDVLSELLSEEDIIVPESAGVTCEVTLQAFRNRRGQRVKLAAGLGSMGFGLPYAIAACIANNQRRTILINGDGAFQLNIQELETLHRLDLPLKIFIWNNEGYASIRGMQRNNFQGRYIASSENSGLTLPNIVEVANAYGIKTYQIYSNREIDKVIRLVLKEKGPVLCEVMINPNEVVKPKVQAKVGTNGEMIPGKLEDMWPYI